MDPNACWAMLVACLNNPAKTLPEDERTALEETSMSLRVWLLRGGVMPDDAIHAGLTRDGAIRLTRAIEYYCTGSISARDF